MARAAAIERAEDFAELFVPRFYFGCEADDPMVAWAFDAATTRSGARLRAMFSSDIGHWDVPDMGGILPRPTSWWRTACSREADFRDFTFANPVRFYTSANPRLLPRHARRGGGRALVAEEALPVKPLAGPRRDRHRRERAASARAARSSSAPRARRST